jgi:hypothetical protein
MCAQRLQPNFGGRRMASRKVTYLGPFYGYPAELIASWCAVTVHTARCYKNGTKRPSPASLKLFKLHRDMKVLGEGWDGWAVKNGSIVDPDGNVTTSGQLAAYWVVMQYAAEIARSNDTADADGLRALLRRA